MIPRFSFAARDRFVEAATTQGFALEGSTTKDEADDLPYGAQVHHESSVEHEEIHARVMELCELAEAAEGDYDGWETMVVTADDEQGGADG